MAAHDTVIRGGLVVDGGGRERFAGDVVRRRSG
jgi:N-acyl-D-aspartate/D-glutamate deacylase